MLGEGGAAWLQRPAVLLLPPVVPHLCTHPHDQHRHSWQILGGAHRSGDWQGSPPCRRPPGVHPAGRKASDSEDLPPSCPHPALDHPGTRKDESRKTQLLGVGRGLTGTCRGGAVPCPCSLPEGLHRPVSSWSGLWARVAGSMASTQGCPPRLWASGARGEPHWPLSGPVDGPEVMIVSRGWDTAPGERDLVPPTPRRLVTAVLCPLSAVGWGGQPPGGRHRVQ